MKNQRGQGLVEYLILVCLIAVSAIAIVTVVGTNIKEQYAQVSAAIRGTRGPKLSAPSSDDYGKRGLQNFNGASSAEEKAGWGF